MRKTHSPYAPEYRRQMVELVRSGRTPGELAREFECSASVIHMTRHEGRRFVEEALLVEGYDAPQNRWLIEPIGREHDDGGKDES